jgi:hypothetical protein
MNEAKSSIDLVVRNCDFVLLDLNLVSSYIVFLISIAKTSTHEEQIEAYGAGNITDTSYEDFLQKLQTSVGYFFANHCLALAGDVFVVTHLVASPI